MKTYTFDFVTGCNYLRTQVQENTAYFLSYHGLISFSYQPQPRNLKYATYSVSIIFLQRDRRLKRHFIPRKSIKLNTLVLAHAFMENLTVGKSLHLKIRSKEASCEDGWNCPQLADNIYSLISLCSCLQSNRSATFKKFAFIPSVYMRCLFVHVQVHQKMAEKTLICI